MQLSHILFILSIMERLKKEVIEFILLLFNAWIRNDFVKNTFIPYKRIFLNLLNQETNIMNKMRAY